MSGGGSPAPRPRLLFYAMYDASVASNAPRVRIQALAAALRRVADVDLVSGSRTARLLALPGLLLRLGRYRGVYVEAPTTSPMPWDLLALAVARARGLPVGVYFRDAYQLFRDLYPLAGWRARLSDLAWRLTLGMLRTLATVHFVQAIRMASLLRLTRPALLPPGTDPEAADLGAGNEPLVAHVGAMNPADGFDRLVDAMTLVRERVPDARLLAIGPPPAAAATLPDWVEVRQATRDQLAALLAPARVCVIPRPITAYTHIVRPVKLSDYLSFGKPVVATATDELRALLEPDGTALLVDDAPRAIADGLLRVLTEPGLAEDLARRSRAMAQRPEMTWDGRARDILAALGLATREGVA
ncbi:MAG TPA: glycosyltransferase [candidate division Zixibacteria bacterium]|nr:glycosyltransferase [candidate division Zixibacteria bacterium]